MERRNFLKKAALGGGLTGALISGCKPSDTADTGPGVQTQKNVRWRLVSSFPRSLDTIFGAADALASRVKELTDGRFDIRVHPAGEIVPGLQVLDAVQKGTAEVGHTASYYYVGKNPALAFDTSLPFGLTTRQQIAWLTEAGGMDHMRALFADFNIINFPGGNTGVQMGGWFRREINEVGDLRGLKMRIPGLGGKVMDRLDVLVQVLAGGDIYQALEKGTIDATEWVGPYDDTKLGFHRVARYYYYPGWWEPGPALSFYVNRDAWATLPSTYQAALATAAAEAGVLMQAEYDAKNPPALQNLLKEGVQLRRFPDDVMEAAHAATAEYLAEQIAGDAQYRKIHAHWSAFKKDSDRWLATAEQAYAEFVYKKV